MAVCACKPRTGKAESKDPWASFPYKSGLISELWATGSIVSEEGHSFPVDGRRGYSLMPLERLLTRQRKKIASVGKG